MSSEKTVKVRMLVGGNYPDPDRSPRKAGDPQPEVRVERGAVVDVPRRVAKSFLDAGQAVEANHPLFDADLPPVDAVNQPLVEDEDDELETGQVV